MARGLMVCQAGTTIGLGHLSRSVVAAEALHDVAGFEMVMLLQTDSPAASRPSRIPRETVDMKDDLSAVVRKRAREFDATVVLFDLAPRFAPANTGELLRDLRREGRRVVSIDALREYRADLDLLFLPSFVSPMAEAKPGEAPVISGWDSFLIDGASSQAPWTPGPRVLVLTGGSDSAGLGQSLPALLDKQLPANAEVHWVTGPFAAKPLRPDRARVRFVWHEAQASLVPLMSQANYALTVFGVSFFELLRHGVPTVVFSPYGGKDNWELDALAREGIAQVAADPDKGVEALAGLLANDEQARGLSRRAAQRMAAPGGTKLANAVLRLVA